MKRVFSGATPRFDKKIAVSLAHRISEDADSLDFGFYQIAWQTIACGRNKPVLGLPASSELSIRRPGGASRCPSDDDATPRRPAPQKGG